MTFSPGCSSDDKMLDNNNYFLNCQIILTEKLDGSNFCFTKDACFARSHAGSPTHKSFDFAKSIHSNIKFSIPENYFVFAEYCFAQHSIFYDRLDHYLHIFAIYNQQDNSWLSWKNIKEFSEAINIPTVPVLFEGIFSSEKDLINKCDSLMKEKSIYGEQREGIVISVTEPFANDYFWKSKGKVVRANHVQTSEHWKDQEIIKNKLILK
jgi:RNA ligase